MTISLIAYSVPHAEQRYDTCGDWMETRPNINDLRLTVRVSELGDWRKEVLVAIHELVEAALCRYAGISQRQVDAFDREFSGDGEPGDSPEAPYHQQHVTATNIERSLALVLDVPWDEHEEAIAALVWPGEK